MKVSRLPTLVLVLGACATGAMLFWTSQNVQEKEHRLASLRDALVKEEKTIRVLETEWDYLNSPDRLEELARQYLDMEQPSIEQIIKTPPVLQDPAYIISPSRKPEHFPQPVSMPLPNGTHKPSVPMPPIRPEKERSFQSLLNDLNTAAGEAR